MGNKNQTQNGQGAEEEARIGPYSSSILGKQTVTVDDFELLKVVGKGSFGKVMQVRHKLSGKIFAMKVLRKETIIQRKQVEHTKTERRILEQITHPFIVSMHFAFQTKEKLYMVLDYFNGGELFHHLKKAGRFPEERAKIYAAEIVSAIDYLHQHNIIYRDLKPENILLDSDGHIRITDFGLSKEGIVLLNGAKTFCGTPEYLAPELLKNNGHGKPVDWWSLGTLLYEMLTGLPPFYSQNLNVMYDKICNAELKFPPYLSIHARSLLSMLLIRDPKKRLGTNGGWEVMRHPFFMDIDWNKLNRREITPPFIPEVAGVNDFRNIDTEFTNMMPQDTPITSNLSESKQTQFMNFTYTDQTELQKEARQFDGRTTAIA